VSVTAPAEAPPRSRRTAVAVASAFVVVVAGVVAAALASGGAPDDTGLEPAPAFALPDVADPSRTIRLTDFEGRPVVLNFWGSWCVPCRKEMPFFEDVHRRAGGRLVVLGIDRLDHRDDAVEFLTDVGVTYPSAYDRDGSLDAPYRLVGMPTTVFVSPDGAILERITGELTAARLEAAVRRHFPGALEGE
jgi:cytochrome c biogenesis protein CcmG/thiol:disulfide interchange protein DsbE